MTLAWKGGGDDDIWNTAWDGTRWGPQAKVKGSSWTAGTSTTPSWISPYINGDPNVLFWKGGSTNIWMSEYNAGSGWESQKQVTCSTNPSWIFETSYAPAAAYNNTPDGAPYAVFWTSSSSTSIFYSYETETSCGWSQPATVPQRCHERCAGRGVSTLRLDDFFVVAVREKVTQQYYSV